MIEFVLFSLQIYRLLTAIKIYKNVSTVILSRGHIDRLHRLSLRKKELENVFVAEGSITKTRLFKYTENFTSKNWNFQIKKNSDIFHISAQNIDCRYSLEPPRRGGSNEYHNLYVFAEAVLTSTHNLCFWAEIRKIMYIPLNPSFTI